MMRLSIITIIYFKAIDRFTVNMRQHLKDGRESGYAAFSNYLAPFQKAFGEDKLLIIDGENMIKNANYEFTKIIKFIGLSSNHFSFNIPNQKGFPCLEEPIKFCLNSAKGTSRRQDVTRLYPRKTNVWRDAFEQSIKKTLLAFKICKQLDSACCSKLNHRFTWASKYFCHS